MSYAKLQTFAKQAAMLDVNDRIELITLLVKSLPNGAKQKMSDQKKIAMINSVLDKIPESEQIQYSDAGLESVREALKNDSW